MHARRTSLAALIVLTASAAAEAQVIGTFSWQTQPYCNVVTVQVIQQGPLYQLAGTDNLCGSGTAPVSGTAVAAGGTVVFGLTAALPSGRAAQLSATVSLSTVSGTWADADGHTGTFAFNGAAAGPPRPAPAAATAITVAQFSPTVYAGTGAATTLARSDHTHDDRYYTQAQHDARAPEAVFAGNITPAIDTAFNALRTVTTTRAGRLDLRMFISWTATCPAGAPTAYLTLDSVAVRTSAVVAATYTGYLSGVTEAIVPAGPHQVGFGWDCATGTTVVSANFPGLVTAIVIP